MVNRSPLSFAILMHLIIVRFFLIINFRFTIPNQSWWIINKKKSIIFTFRMVCRLFNGKLVASTLLDRVRHVSLLVSTLFWFVRFISSRIITKKTKLSQSSIKNKHTNNFFFNNIIITILYILYSLYIMMSYFSWDINITSYFTEKLVNSSYSWDHYLVYY